MRDVFNNLKFLIVTLFTGGLVLGLASCASTVEPNSEEETEYAVDMSSEPAGVAENQDNNNDTVEFVSAMKPTGMLEAAPPPPPSESEAPPKISFEEYVVSPGDSLGSIAHRFFGRASAWRQIATANDLSNPHKLKLGQVLRIEGATTSVPSVSSQKVVDEKEVAQAITGPSDPNLKQIQVRKGSTLSSIASEILRDGSKWPRIWELNKTMLPNPHFLRVGQTLVYDLRDVPTVNTH